MKILKFIGQIILVFGIAYPILMLLYLLIVPIVIGKELFSWLYNLLEKLLSRLDNNIWVTKIIDRII